MEDKLIELVTKMYSEMTVRLDTLDKKLDNKSDKTDIVRIENKLDTNSKALFDGYKQTYEKLGTLETKVDNMSQKIEKQDVEFKVFKGGK